jgi:hypothetical protein
MQKHKKRKNVPAIGKIRRKSGENPEEELHTLLTISLSGAMVLLFFHIFPASFTKVHRLNTVDIGGGYE